MGALITIAFLVAAATILWTVKVVVFDSKAGNRGRLSYVGVTVIVAIAAYWSTYNYDYLPDANTHVHGWPIPVVVFQRDSATSRWLDFVGPTTVLGLPMNFIIFMLAPSLIFLTTATWHRWRFSLRTLLIAMTLVAVVLGLAVYVARR
jgi:riboflavin transporter FmnP